MAGIIVDFLSAAVLGLLVLAILVRVLGWQNSPEAFAAADLFIVFAFVFLLVWTGGIWIPPFPPVFWGSYLVSFVVAAGFVLAILAFTGIPDHRRQSGRPWRRAFYILYPLLILTLILAIYARYTVARRF